jgi:hypothetical protein
MDEPVLVYVLAASHSGSTLTAMLLNAHPDICTAGELKATSLGDTGKYRCSCRTLIGDCPFWLRVSAEMKRLGFEYDVRDARTSLQDVPSRYAARLLRPLHRPKAAELLRDLMLQASPVWRRYLPGWTARNQALIRAIATVAGVRVVADSSKIAIRLKYLKKNPDLRVKVVHLVRDGRAVALTYMDPAQFADAADPQLRGGGSGEERHRRLTMTEAATEWLRSNEEAREVLGTMPAGDHIRISYEDICTDPGRTLKKVHRFLSLPEDDAFARFRSATHHVVGNGMRLDDGSDIRLDDRWRRTLTGADLREFDRVAGKLNRSLGYN